MPSLPDREVRRVRHPLKLRRLQVLRTQRLSPNVVCITLGGPELADFTSDSFDDHVKLMLPGPGQTELVLPTMAPGGPVPPDSAPPLVMRDYTPRRFDRQACELDIEFALHGDGPAAAWAAQVQPGQAVGIGGPRGSFVVPTGFDWHLLIGDDTALPAITRRLAELPAGASVLAVVAIDPADRRALATAAHLQLHWVAPDADVLVKTVAGLTLPEGEGYAWAAGEARAMARVREVLIHTHGITSRRCRCAAYWKAGAIAHHENLEGSAG